MKRGNPAYGLDEIIGSFSKRGIHSCLLPDWAHQRGKGYGW